ncbi:hypothetical protein LOE07_16940 [Pseudosulfitobacter pseudonitzschiae]|uniref:hypothetical protein n=1 Tax=Pseudosulfitobacter pseudonitzschiae TaxID=1402135 RepID=UPI001E296052|nr:hypothetical protein [Pseudosulfitobacter pseudonitzschiae]UFF64243.1 hypothetical protein LOE07_16940 [Pseudosulfitobacter pseudonitzschiae]
MTGFGDILVAELGSEDKAANLAGITELTAEGVRLILLGRQNDVETYRSYIGAGARDYLVLPVEAETQVALGLGQTQAARTPTVASSRVIGVCGVTGGVGPAFWPPILRSAIWTAPLRAHWHATITATSR